MGTPVQVQTGQSSEKASAAVPGAVEAKNNEVEDEDNPNLEDNNVTTSEVKQDPKVSDL